MLRSSFVPLSNRLQAAILVGNDTIGSVDAVQLIEELREAHIAHDITIADKVMNGVRDGLREFPVTMITPLLESAIAGVRLSQQQAEVLAAQLQQITGSMKPAKKHTGGRRKKVVEPAAQTAEADQPVATVTAEPTTEAPADDENDIQPSTPVSEEMTEV